MEDILDFNNWNAEGGIPNDRQMSAYYIELFRDIFSNSNIYSLGVSYKN